MGLPCQSLAKGQEVCAVYGTDICPILTQDSLDTAPALHCVARGTGLTFSVPAVYFPHTSSHSG